MWGPSAIDLAYKKVEEDERKEAEGDKQKAEEQGICMECYYGQHAECTFGSCTCDHHFKD
jgi:hypothetical protein